MIIALYLGAIVAANLITTAYGPAASIVTAFIAIGLDLTARDKLHEAWSHKHLARNMALLIATGSIISWLLNRNAGSIALASCVAFGAAATIDTICYMLLRRYSRFYKINGSNIASAAVDSLLFPAIAFGWPLLWGVMLGQFIAKVGGGFVWSLLLDVLTAKLAQRDTAHATGRTNSRAANIAP